MSIRCRTSVSVATNCKVATSIDDNGKIATSIGDNPRIATDLFPPDPTEDDLTFEQFDGPVVFPVNAFSFPGLFGDLQFYTVETAEGENRVHLSRHFLGISHDHGSGAIPHDEPDGGAFASVWEGISLYNVEDDTYFSTLQATLSEGGILPTGYFGLSNAGPDRVVQGPTTFTALFNTLNSGTDGRFYFASREFTQGPMADGAYFKKWSSSSPLSAGQGFFVNAGMNFIWVDGYTLLVTYSDPIAPADLNIPVARIGTSARTQHITDLTGTTYSGTLSRAKKRVAIPAGKTKMVAEVKYLVTPEIGSPYFIFVTQEFDVTPLTTYEAVLNFPSIPNASVFYFSATFNFTVSVYYGFSSFNPLIEYVKFQPSPGWPLGSTFSESPRCADVWDNYQDFASNTDSSEGDVDETQVSDLGTGYGWLDGYKFLSVDFEDIYDNFEGYTEQNYAILVKGLGFAGPGQIAYVVIPDVIDDFETYSIGPIMELGLVRPEWLGPGLIVLGVYLDVFDNFETYSVGSISVLDFPGTYWEDDGGIAV